jgi:SSS family solute:Na+ symporter
MNPTILAIVAVYFVVTLSLGLWVARKERNVADDYFLAGRKLPWYAVALSMTGSNIGTEHFIGMVGSAYAFGLAPATFEWGNFIPFSVLIWIFLPYFFRKKLYTVPEFLERRYGASTRSVFAGLTLFHMVFVVLTPALYAGGRIVYEMGFDTTIDSFNWGYMGCVLIISAVTAAYCIYGGLLSVVWTDVLQVVILLVGGVMLVVIGSQDVGGIDKVIERNLAESSTDWKTGNKQVPKPAAADDDNDETIPSGKYHEAGPTRMSLILPSDHPLSPWTGVATFWFTLSLWYCCTNQFYIQRCLGAKSEWDAKMGVIGCGFLKIFLPFIIVLPGLVAFAKFGPSTLSPDAVYVTMVKEFLPTWGQGILLAALIAAIMSTVSSVLNSTSTIWAMDVHKRILHKGASEAEVVRVGRWATLVTIVIGTAAAPALLYWEEGLFIYIQDMAALLAPPIVVVFLAAFLWRRAHGRSATFTLVFGILCGAGLMVLGKTAWSDDIAWIKPLLNRAAINWVFCLAALVLSTYLIPRNQDESYDPDAIWNARWARLPEQERPRNRGYRNLMFWWLVMVSTSASLFMIFR